MRTEFCVVVVEMAFVMAGESVVADEVEVESVAHFGYWGGKGIRDPGEWMIRNGCGRRGYLSVHTRKENNGTQTLALNSRTERCCRIRAHGRKANV